MGLFSELGIESFTFRTYPDHKEVIEATKACGVNQIELCGMHFDPAASDPVAIMQQYKDGGVIISSIFPFHALGADEATDRKTFEFAKVAGIKYITGMVDHMNIEKADRLAQEYGIKIAVHNHGRHDRFGPVWALEDLFSQTSPAIGLCLDTAWMLDSGEDPIEAAKKFQDRLYGFHLKDFVFDRAGRPEDVIVGTGNLDIDALANLLVDTKFDGFLTLEFEGDESHPVPATTKCVEAIKAAFERAEKQ